MTDVSTIASSDVEAIANDGRELALGASEINSVVSFEDAIARSAAAANVAPGELVSIGSPWLSLDGVGGKDYLVEKPFHIVDVAFNRDKDTDRPYAVAHVVTQANEMFYVTDGSTGIFAQLLALVQERRKNGHPTPYEGFTIANGLRKSEYLLTEDKNGRTIPMPKNSEGYKTTGKATTYYLA